MTKRRPQAKNSPATKASGRSRGKTARLLAIDEHDEPIVVDNCPVRVDFGQSPLHPTTPGTGKSWQRDFSREFQQLIVMRDDQNGNRTRHQVLRGLKGATIRLELVRESNPSVKERLTFEVMDGGSTGRIVVMTPENDTFGVDSNQPGRLKPSELNDLRLTKVSIGARQISLTPFGQRVAVVIVPKPE